jgi:hypothetical protein
MRRSAPVLDCAASWPRRVRPVRPAVIGRPRCRHCSVIGRDQHGADQTGGPPASAKPASARQRWFAIDVLRTAAYGRTPAAPGSDRVVASFVGDQSYCRSEPRYACMTPASRAAVCDGPEQRAGHPRCGAHVPMRVVTALPDASWACRSGRQAGGGGRPTHSRGPRSALGRAVARSRRLSAQRPHISMPRSGPPSKRPSTAQPPATTSAPSTRTARRTVTSTRRDRKPPAIPDSTSCRN